MLNHKVEWILDREDELYVYVLPWKSVTEQKSISYMI